MTHSERLRRFLFSNTLIYLYLSLDVFFHPLVFANESEKGVRVLRVAAASNLRFSMDDIAVAFERSHGIKLEISYGASGNLFAQIKSGAPFDLFLSADEAMPKQLIVDGLGITDGYFTYGTGRIVLWVSNTSHINLDMQGIRALLDRSIQRIAIANPRYAPYGLAAVATLRHNKLYTRLEKKLVIAENASQAAAFVRNGATDIGILSYSMSLSEPLLGLGRYWLIPSSNHSSLTQGGLILSRSAHQRELKSLVRFLMSGDGSSILRNDGFFE